MSQLLNIWVKRVRRGPMDPLARAAVVAGRGIAGNVDQGGRRQVTIVSQAVLDRVTATLPSAPDPAMRRANLLVSDVDLVNARDRILRVGAVRIRILGEMRPCERMDEALAGLQSALAVPWGGGAFGEVLDDGEIAVGDPVTLEPAERARDRETPSAAIP